MTRNNETIFRYQLTGGKHIGDATALDLVREREGWKTTAHNADRKAKLFESLRKELDKHGPDARVRDVLTEAQVRDKFVIHGLAAG